MKRCWITGGYFPVVSRGETNSAGEVFFSHLVKHYSYNLGDRYACKGYSKEVNASFSYKPRYFTYPNSVPYPYLNPAPPNTPGPLHRLPRSGPPQRHLTCRSTTAR